MFKTFINKLAADFGFVSEAVNSNVIDDADAKQQELEMAKNSVDAKLNRSAKLDEIDTITFGLETDDGKIVKVYVNKDQANDFEKALSEKLGELDDIEEVLNVLSKDFEIVDVEWPQQTEDDEEDDTLSGDGIMNSKVYHNKKDQADADTKVKAAEGLSYGETVTANLLESDANNVEARLNTANQLMVYNAILQLGIPEIVLDKSPYRALIIKGIRAKGLELNSNASMKTALKMFVNKSVDYDKRAEENIKKHGVDENLDTDQEPLLENERTVQFWEFVTSLIKYLSPDTHVSDRLLNSPRFKTLMSRSTSAITNNVTGPIRVKIANMKDALQDEITKVDLKKVGVVENLSEAVKPEEAEALIGDMLRLADSSTDGKLSRAVMDSQPYAIFMKRARAKLTQKFMGKLRQKLNALQRVLAQGGNAVVEPVTEGIIVEYSVKWEFTNVDDNMKLQNDAFTMLLDPENFEKLLKGITNHDAVIVKDADDPMIKYAFSPRGSSLQVKKVGQNQAYVMSSTDVNELLSMSEKVTESLKSKQTVKEMKQKFKSKFPKAQFQTSDDEDDFTVLTVRGIDEPTAEDVASEFSVDWQEDDEGIYSFKIQIDDNVTEGYRPKEGERVILLPFEGQPQEEGECLGSDDGEVYMVQVDKKYRVDKRDDGLREVTPDQIKKKK